MSDYPKAKAEYNLPEGARGFFETPVRPLTLIDLIGRLNNKLQVTAERVLPEPDDSGTFYVTNKITDARIHSGLTVVELIEHARTLGAIGPDEEFTA